jgi:dTDP-glucose pyrophosphorylase
VTPRDRRWQDTVVGQDLPLLDAIARLDAVALQILLVTDEDGRLVGTVTDGDVRRAILRQMPLDSRVADAMYRSPTTISLGTSRDEAMSRMRELHLRQLPILDAAGRPIGLELIDEVPAPPIRPNAVVLMAGGLGKRLRPLTEKTPKPLLRVGGRPLLETIIQSFAEHGFTRIFLSINYRADQVEAYFGDGSQFGVRIEYLREDEALGTAGALGLLPQTESEPIVVMNGDILTRLDFGQLIDFHTRTNAQLTMCVREYEVEVPYGVVEVEGEEVTSLAEKPTARHFVNAGIYVLRPSLIAIIGEAERLDMTDLAHQVMARNGRLSAFPIREYWLDIGHLKDYERAQADFTRYFTKAER